MSEIIPIQITKQDVIYSNDCETITVQKKRLIVIKPSTLILQLMRFNFDTANDKTSKINEQIFCPPSILMPGGSTYFLTSIINHIGEETNSGHYNTILFQTDSENSLLLDDYDISYVQDDNNGISDLSYICTFERDIQI